MPDNTSGVSWAEVWELHAEVESRWSCRLELRVCPPRELPGGKYYPPRVCVALDPHNSGAHKPLSRYVQLGGRGGASNAAAAFHRALSEAYWTLEQRENDAAQQAAF